MKIILTQEVSGLGRSTTMAKAVIRKPKKKVCQFCKEKAVSYTHLTLPTTPYV